MVRDPISGKYRRMRLFVMTLGYSRKSVRLLVFRSSSQIWAELHEKAFRRLTGVTRVVVLDNLREGVLTPDILRSRTQSTLSGCAPALRRCRSTLPRRRSGSQGKGGVRCRPCAENAAEGPPLRKPGGSPDLPGSVGNALGRHAHPRHHQAAGRRHVRRREADTAAAARRALPLLPIRRTHSAPGWLRGSRSG